MSQLRLKEQISFLRKQKQMTQEELAQKLGVSNQSVSKWESGQCCPDIQLLPEIAVYAWSGIFMADYTTYMSPTAEQMRGLQLQLKQLMDKNVLTVLYALYQSSIRDMDLYVSVDDLAAETHLGKMQVEEALEHIPVTVKNEKGKTLYRICGSFMHVPPILLMLRES